MGESGMETKPKRSHLRLSAWQVKQVYAMAVISLVVGLAIGYLFAGRNRPRRRHLHPPYPSSLPPQVPWAARRQAWIR